jgi:hypothetical protein
VTGFNVVKHYWHITCSPETGSSEANCRFKELLPVPKKRAFEAAVEMDPGETIEIRQGASVVARSRV